MSKEAKFWGQEEDERLTYTERDIAIESILDGPITELPETIEVCGFNHIKLTDADSLAEGVLKRFLERLDEEYSDPDGSYTDPTDKMTEASKEFVATVVDEYKVWACELVSSETINVQKWIKENRPEWLEENDKWQQLKIITGE